MNALTTDVKFSYELQDVSEDVQTKFGDILAFLIVLSFSAFALIISGWSAIVYLAGSGHNGGPLGYIFRFVYSAVDAYVTV